MKTRPWVGNQTSRVELLSCSHCCFCRQPQFAAALDKSIVQSTCRAQTCFSSSTVSSGRGRHLFLGLLLHSSTRAVGESCRYFFYLEISTTQIRSAIKMAIMHNTWHCSHKALTATSSKSRTLFHWNSTLHSLSSCVTCIIPQFQIVFIASWPWSSRMVLNRNSGST